jgi:MYXO-CTERM domain-containing protein
MLLRRPWLLVPIVLLAAASSAAAAPPPLSHPVIDRTIPLAFLARPRPFGAPGVRPAPLEVPVVVRYSRAVRAADLGALRDAGARSVEAFAGMPGAAARLALADASAAALAAIAELDGVERITLDGSPFPAPRPLDFTAAQVQATDVWRTRGADALPLDGHGITICDIDSGVDVFHPLLFRADGNGGKPYLPWIDVNGDGQLTPGTDAVDLHGDGATAVLRVLNSTTTNIYDTEPLFGTEDPALDVGFDYLYADTNGNGARDQGPAAGFTEQDPTYGEQLFLVDDVDRDGALDLDEKLVALGSSKVKSVRFDGKVYRRGENLIDLPVDEGFAHGTGAMGVLAGGTIGLTRLVGMAPGADLVMATNSDGTAELQLAKFCRTEGARVVLHEYAPWYGYHLDGSSPMEAFIDSSSAEGMVHVNPAGNLSGSEKLYKNAIAAGATTDVIVEAPDWGFTFFGASFLWRDPSRSLTFLVEDPTGFTKEVPAATPIFEDWHDGLSVYAAREDSIRGTARVDLYVFNQGPTAATVPSGTWKIHVTDPSPPGSGDVTLIGYVADELSGWGKGIHFPEHTSEEHYIGYPGTADHGMPIAAYTGHGYWGAEPDLRAPYSGRGVRIDGEPILWISAPDDPVTSGTREGVQALHLVYGGTSGASPHVAGGAALLLAQNPALSGDDVKEAIRKSALVDDAVLSAGPAPNTDYGHGKLRIYESLYGEPPPGGSAPELTIAEVAVNAGNTAKLAIEASDADQPASSLTFEADIDYDGTFEAKLEGPEVAIPTSAPGTVVSRVRVTDDTGRSTSAFAVVRVLPEGTLPELGTGKDPTSEGGCSVPAGGAGEAPAWLLGALAMLGLRRRRAR